MPLRFEAALPLRLEPERLRGDWLPFLLRGVRDRLFLSIVGLPETERLGDRMVPFSTSFCFSFGVGERLFDFGDRALVGSAGSLESF